MKNFKIFILIVSVLILSVLSIFYLIYHKIPNDFNNSIRLEIIKSILSVISIAIIGSLISILFKSYERYRQQNRIREKAKIDFMKRISELYRATISTKRKLSGNGISTFDLNFVMTIDKEQIQFYLKEMEVIYAIQLELNGISITLDNNELYNYPDKVSKKVKLMSDYLEDLVTESENNYGNLKNFNNIDLNSLPILKNFTFKGNDSDFEIKFSRLYYDILLCLN